MSKTATSTAVLVAGASLLALTQSSAAAAAVPYPPTETPVVISNASTGFYLTTDAQSEAEQYVTVYYHWPLLNDGSGSIWRLQHRGGDRYTIETEQIKSTKSFCLTTPENAKNNGALQAKECNSETSQSWTVREQRNSETYTITPSSRNFQQWAITTQGQNYGAPDAYVTLKHFTGAHAPTNMRWKIDSTSVPQN